MKWQMMILFVLLSFSAQSQKDRKSIQEGNDLFHKGQYDNAIKKYEKALEKDKHPITLYNQGTAQYKSNKLDEAISSLQASISAASSTDQKAKAHYNLGDAYYKKDQLDESIHQFKEALKFNPKDADSKKNLLVAKWKKKQMEQKQKNKDKNKDDKEKGQKNNEQKDKEKNKSEDDPKNKGKEENQGNSSNKDATNNDLNKSGQQPKLSKDEMKRLTDFIQGEDQKVQEKLQRVSNSSHRPLKDW